MPEVISFAILDQYTDTTQARASQTQEEMVHATKFMDYLLERDGRVELLEIEKPKMEWDSPLQALLMLDRELANRAALFTLPTAGEE